MPRVRLPRRLLPVAAVLVTAPFLPGIVGSSAGAPRADGPGIHHDVEPGSGPAGDAPVVERQVADDMVVDWLATPPAGAADWVDAALEDAASGPGASAEEDHPPAEAPAGPDADAPVVAAGSSHPTAYAEAADGSTQTGTPSVSPGQGFAVFSATPRWRTTGYTIRLTGPDGGVEQYRDELEAAARDAEAATGLPVRVAPGTGGREEPASGEITVVVGTGPCGSAAVGCGGPAYTETELVSGRVWLYPAALSMGSADRLNLATHELGHALGLQHYNSSWAGSIQAMYPQVAGISAYRPGDVSGLRFMAGAFDPSAGSVTGRTYAAGYVWVTGTVSSGTQVRVTAGAASQDVSATNGAFLASVAAPAGSHQVCATVLDAAAGFRRDLGCAPVDAPGAPSGSFEGAGDSFETVVVSGWALDPQTADPVQVEVRRNGELVTTAAADGARPDIAAAFPHYGEAHGFRVEVPAVEGANDVCVRVKGVGAGGDAELGCGRVVHAVQPVGAFELATGGDLTATVSGWALDPNTPDPVKVTVTVDGAAPALPGTFTADQDRADVARTHPAHGPAHGFSQRLVLTPGRHEVCLTVRDVGLGQDQRLGCTTVEVGPQAVGQVLTTVTASVPTSVLAPVTSLVDQVLTG
ncbi:MAG TPA: hypothetical protein VFV32_10575, partial [Acidimicrobiales bacterium]|nr:hypothetical protein [Acidimicrobiales bacterium]